MSTQQSSRAVHSYTVVNINSLLGEGFLPSNQSDSGRERQRWPCAPRLPRTNSPTLALRGTADTVWVPGGSYHAATPLFYYDWCTCIYIHVCTCFKQLYFVVYITLWYVQCGSQTYMYLWSSGPLSFGRTDTLTSPRAILSFVRDLSYVHVLSVLGHSPIRHHNVTGSKKPAVLHLPWSYTIVHSIFSVTS